MKGFDPPYTTKPKMYLPKMQLKQQSAILARKGILYLEGNAPTPHTDEIDKYTGVYTKCEIHCIHSRSRGIALHATKLSL